MAIRPAPSGNTLERVILKRKSLKDYQPIVGKEVVEEIRDVAAGYECGLGLDTFNDLQVKDQIEFFHREEIART